MDSDNVLILEKAIPTDVLKDIRSKAYMSEQCIVLPNYTVICMVNEILDSRDDALKELAESVEIVQ